MNRIKQTISVAFAVAVLSLGWAPAQAQKQRPHRINDRQVENALRRVETHADRFRADMRIALRRSGYNGTRAEDNVNNFIRDFEQATDQLRSRFNSRKAAASDVENILRQATYIDDFMTRETLSVKAEKGWTKLKGDLNQLASAYNLAWNWDVNSLPIVAK
jgi:hypothetical protein